MGAKLTQAEGFILGVGAKMFTIAGPVIVYGVSASVVYGLILLDNDIILRKESDGSSVAFFLKFIDMFLCKGNQMLLQRF